VTPGQTEEQGDGLIIEQRDCFDLWGDIFNGIPRFRGPHRKFMRRYSC